MNFGLSVKDSLAAADGLELLDSIDEGEHTDSDELRRLVGLLREAALLGDYRLWVSKDRCSRMEIWNDGRIIVAFRDHSSRVWGPPIDVHEEKVHA